MFHWQVPRNRLVELTTQELTSAKTNWTFALISITLLVYEYIITFAYEVERFWPRWLRNSFDFGSCGYRRDSKGVWSGPRGAAEEQCGGRGGRGFPWVSFFFFTNRYLTILGHVPVMVEYFWVFNGTNAKKQICGRLELYHWFLTIAIQVICGCILVMRVYALYDHRRWVIVLFIVTFIAAITVALWAVISNKTVGSELLVVTTPHGCGKAVNSETAIHLVVAWIGDVVFDTLVFGMTLYKTLTLPRGSGAKLLTILMRDGTMYFGVMMVANIGNVLSYIFAAPPGRGSVAMFANVISSIMVSRLMLNLRDPKLCPYKIRSWSGRNEESMMMSGLGLPQESTINGKSGVLTVPGGDLINSVTTPPNIYLDVDSVQEVVRG